MSLFLFGQGEHARVVAEAAAVRACLNRDDEADLPALRERHPNAGFHLAIGDNLVRRAAAERLSSLPWCSVIHPRAWVSPSAHLGHGVFIGAQAVIQAGAIIGDHVIINSAVVVEHDCRIASYCHLCPGAILGGGVEVGEGCLVGLGARIRDHHRIGAQATVGMGAVVVADVAPGRTVLGVPARERRS
jgi:acetyltransferase EpsM